MPTFFGEYEATVDAKGRFLLPGGFKKQLPEGENRFVITRGFEKCLNLYPIKSWEPIVEEFSLKNPFEKNVRDFRRQFFGGATEVELDTAGRLLLPPTLKEYANLTKDIILVAALNYIEIWDAEKYKKLFEDISPEAYGKLAAEVMGNKAGTNL